MTRVVPAVLALAGIWGALPGATLRAEERSLAAELLAVYVERCEKEVQVLAKQLDELHEQVLAELPEEKATSVLAAVDAAWERGEEAVRLYRRLEDSPRKFTRWSRESDLPAWFAVPDSVAQVRRWEALRPILAPIAGGDRLDWHEPDAEAWATRPGSWRFEHLLLLRWSSRELAADLPDPVRESARAWVEEQAGGGFAESWRGLDGEEIALFHEQYVYTLAAPPPPTEGLPPRLRAVVDRLFPRPEPTPLGPFQRDKDAFLIDLLAQIVDRGDSHSTAVAWFDAGARAFPPLLAFEPEGTGDGVRAVVARRDPTLRRLRERLDSEAPDAGGPDAAVRAVLSRAVFRSQARLEPGGGLDIPAASWSTWIPSPPDPARQLDRVPPPAPLPAAGPASVWSRICLWVLDRLAAAGVEGPVRFTVENASGWSLAFRAEELAGLAKELGRTLTFTSASTGESVDVSLSIAHLEAHRTIPVELQVDGRSAGAERFQVPGPWPPWFASRRGLDPGSFWTWAALLAWGTLALVFRRRALTVTLLSVGLASALVILLCGPVPISSPELGGILEFSLPLHAAVPPAQRRVMEPIVRGVYEQVAAQLSETSLLAWTPPSWWTRFLRSLRSAGDLKAIDAPALRAPRLAEIEYRITRAGWPRGAPVRQGRLAATDGERFGAVLGSLTWEGEPAPPRALRTGPDPGVRLVVSFWDGDHGALRPPSGGAGKAPGPAVLSIFLPSPTRDGRPARLLDLGSRYRWISERSTRTLSLLQDHREALVTALPSPGLDADASAAEPTDLEALRQRFWEPAGGDPARLGRAASEIARHAVELITRADGSGARGSRSVLRLRRSPQRSLAMWLLALTAVAFWLASPGHAPHQFYRVFLVGAAGLALRAAPLLCGLAAVDATLSPRVWSYGGTSTGGMVYAFWMLLTTLCAAGVLRLAAWVIEAWKGSPDFYKTVSDRAHATTGRHAVPGWRQVLALIAFATSVLLWAAAPVRDANGGAWLPGTYGAVTMAGLFLWTVGTASLLQTSDRSFQHGSFPEPSRRRSSF